METTAFNLAGTSIRKIEETSDDLFMGPLNEMLAVGILRPDQLPPAGKSHVSWSQCVRVMKNCKKDETYMRVMVFRDEVRVWRGLPIAVRQEREHAQRESISAEVAKIAARRHEDDKAHRDQVTRQAKRNLQHMPKSPEAFRRHMVDTLRSMIKGTAEIYEKQSTCHGYRIDAESLQAILISTDAVVEAVVAATVHFDSHLHNECASRYQRQICEANPQFKSQIAALAVPNPSLIEGEAA